MPTINKVRPHQSLAGNPPEPREVEPPARGKIISCRYQHCVAKTKVAGSTTSDLYREMLPTLDTLRNFFYAPTLEMKITFDLLRRGRYAL